MLPVHGPFLYIWYPSGWISVINDERLVVCMQGSSHGSPRICIRDGQQYYKQDCEMKRCLDIARCWPPEDESGNQGVQQGIFQF